MPCSSNFSFLSPTSLKKEKEVKKAKEEQTRSCCLQKVPSRQSQKQNERMVICLCKSARVLFMQYQRVTIRFFLVLDCILNCTFSPYVYEFWKRKKRVSEMDKEKESRTDIVYLLNKFK